MNYKVIDNKIVVFFILLLINSSCKKLVEVNSPFTSITGNSVYTNDATAISAITGMYIKLGATNFNFATGNNSISLLSGLSADELSLWSGISNTVNLAYYYTNSLISTEQTSVGSENWAPMFNYIYTCNSAIEGLSNANTLTDKVKQQLVGEAKFIRALCYFYLVNLYGNVPLVEGTDYTQNALLPRSNKSDVYNLIISDLKDSKSLLNSDYLDATLLKSTTDRLRPTKWVASSLLARVYLYLGDWVNSEAESTLVLNNKGLYNLSPINNVFLKNSSEAIWQLQPINSGWNTEDAKLFILNTAPSNSKPVYLSKFLLNSFEVGDKRRINWVKDTTYGGVKYSYPYKYKSAKSGDPITEYLMVFRLSEQYLIRAESRAQLENIMGAQSDLNAIRARAGLANTTTTNKATLLSEILHERQSELFTEWGHRWLDLKRSSYLDSVMTSVTPQKSNGNSWKSYQQFYPLPISDIMKNRELEQNPNY